MGASPASFISKPKEEKRIREKISSKRKRRGEVGEDEDALNTEISPKKKGRRASEPAPF